MFNYARTSRGRRRHGNPAPDPKFVLALVESELAKRSPVYGPYIPGLLADNAATLASLIASQIAQTAAPPPSAPPFALTMYEPPPDYISLGVYLMDPADAAMALLRSRHEAAEPGGPAFTKSRTPSMVI